MAPANCQIVTAYEECDMTPEEISREMGYDLSAVKYALMSGSSKFCDSALTKANDAEGNPQLSLADSPLFDDNVLREAKGVMRELMNSSEIDMVRLRAATFVIDEAKGRNDLKALKETKLNITVVSETMIRARQAMARAKGKALDVLETNKQQLIAA